MTVCASYTYIRYSVLFQLEPCCKGMYMVHLERTIVCIHLWEHG